MVKNSAKFFRNKSSPDFQSGATNIRLRWSQHVCFKYVLGVGSLLFLKNAIDIWHLRSLDYFFSHPDFQSGATNIWLRWSLFLGFKYVLRVELCLFLNSIDIWHLWSLDYFFFYTPIFNRGLRMYGSGGASTCVLNVCYVCGHAYF